VKEVEKCTAIKNTNLPQLVLPQSLNYIGLFLQFECNLNCKYCINDPEQQSRRSELFNKRRRSKRNHLTPDEWARGLSRLPSRSDLPITLQGGEPTLYYGSKGLGMLLSQVSHHFDLLTNFVLPPELLIENLLGQENKLRRNAPYPSIRVSYHAEEMNRIWNNKGFETLIERCEELNQLGFKVTGDKLTSDIGIYMVSHPSNQVTRKMQELSRGRVPFETKEFLGVDKGKLYGHYLYPFSTDLLTRHIYTETLKAECKTSELLLDPLGFVWGCHYYLYENWKKGGPLADFEILESAHFNYKSIESELFVENNIRPVGHLLDPHFTLDDLNIYRSCSHYGRCIGCDTKVKNDRYQSYENKGKAHTSVSIRNIKIPFDLASKIEGTEEAKKFILLEENTRQIT